MLSVIRVERTSARDTKRDPRVSWFLTLDDPVSYTHLTLPTIYSV